MIYLIISTAVLAYLLIGEFRTRKRLERMNAKALIQVAELRDRYDELRTNASRVVAITESHLKSHVCERVQDEEWPDEIEI